MTPTRSVLALTLAAAAGVSFAGPAVASVPPPPKPPIAMPAAVDVPMPYEPQTTCDQVTKPGVAAFAKIVSAHYKRYVYGTVRTCLSDTSEHYDGRALDWMMNSHKADDLAIGNAVATWLTGKDGAGKVGGWARRFGIMYIIWNRNMWRSYRDIGTWNPYTGSVPHTDHLHFSFAWDGACKRTSWWTGKALTAANPSACYSGPAVTVDTEFTKYKSTVLKRGSTGDAVRLVQTNLPGVFVDGDFGPKTDAAVKAFQSKYGLKVNGIVALAVWNRMERIQYPLIAYRKTVTLTRGSTGVAVKKAQWALRLPQSGVFTDTMVTRVKQVQTKYRLTPDGVVGPFTWAALDEELRSRMKMREASRELDDVITGALAKSRDNRRVMAKFGG